MKSPMLGGRGKTRLAQRVQWVPYPSSLHPPQSSLTSISSSAPCLWSHPGFLILSHHPGSSQMSAFGAAPLAAGTQPSSLADVGGLLGPRVAAGGLPGRWVQM